MKGGQFAPDRQQNSVTTGHLAAPTALLSVHEPLFSYAEFSGLINGAIDNGRMRGGHLERLGVECRAGSLQGVRLSYLDSRELLLEALRGCDRDAAILGHAARLGFASFGELGFKAATQPTMADAVRFGVALQRDFYAGVEVAELAPGANGSLDWACAALFADPEIASELSVITAVNGVALSRSQCPHVRVADEVEVSGTGGVSLSALREFFGCPVRIGEVTRVRLSKAFLQSAPLLAHLGGKPPHAGMAADTPEQRVTAPSLSPLQFLRHHFSAIHSADDMARLLGVSRRTLNRMLERDGTSYSALSDEVRRQHAMRLLRKGHTVADAAEKLSFSDDRSFRRAFRRWTGQAPSEIRVGSG